MAMVQNGTDAKAKPYHKINFMKFNIHLHTLFLRYLYRPAGRPAFERPCRLWLLAATLAMFDLTRPSTVSAQGTAFTYQGRLNDGSECRQRQLRPDSSP